MNINATAFFGEGNGDILIQNVNCKGTESSLLDCGKDDVTVQNCSHHYDVGVKCNIFFQSIFLLNFLIWDFYFQNVWFQYWIFWNLRPYASLFRQTTGSSVRLVNGTHEWEGLVEMYDGGAWKGLCAQNWNTAEARVACRSLGFDGYVKHFSFSLSRWLTFKIKIQRIFTVFKPR